MKSPNARGRPATNRTPTELATVTTTGSSLTRSVPHNDELTAARRRQLIATERNFLFWSRLMRQRPHQVTDPDATGQALLAAARRLDAADPAAARLARQWAKEVTAA